METAEKILAEVRQSLQKFKATVDFRGLGRTSAKSSKIAVKFIKQPEQENQIIEELQQISGAKVWRYVERETIMIKQIPKWIGDDDVLPDLVASNHLNPDGISLVRFIDSEGYSNKRAIVKVDRENAEKIKQNPKLKVGFGFAECAILNSDPKKIICHHCKQAGHRAYRREKQTTTGGVETEYKRVLTCPNAQNV